MIITEKMIKELQRRVDVSYEEAERYLRRAGGNIEIAQAYCNKRNSSVFSRLFHEIEKLINATLIYRIKLYKGKDQFINLPVFYFILFVLIVGINKSLFVGVVFIILSLISDCNIEMAKVDRRDPFSFYGTVDKLGRKGDDRESMDTEDLDDSNDSKDSNDAYDSNEANEYNGSMAVAEILEQKSKIDSASNDNRKDSVLDGLNTQEYVPSHMKTQNQLQQSQSQHQTAQYSPFPSDMDRRVATRNEEHNDEDGYFEVTIDK